MDMVTMTIIDSTMVSICREMGISLMKTSYSTIFNEGLDFTCALADAEGEMIAVAEFNPAQIGGMPLVVQSSVRELSTEPLEPGDVIVHNDPYRGGLAHARAFLLHADLRRWRADGLCGRHRPCGGSGRLGARRLSQRGDGDLP